MNIIFPVSEIPVTREYDVLVVGAGMSGIAAAVNAARQGLNVGMIESCGRPGGVPVSGLLGVISGCQMEREYVVGGFMRELLERAARHHGVIECWGGGTFEPEKLSMTLLELLTETRIEVRFYTPLIAARTEERCLQYAVTASKSGLEAIAARLFVDDTGDGDLAVMAGCPFEMGRPGDGKVQSSSLTFKIGGLERHRIPPVAEITAVWQRHPHRVPTDHAVVTALPDGDVVVNMTHILNCNCTRTADLTRIRVEGTRQAFEITDFFRTHLAGFEHAYVAGTAEQIGIRETRRILGDYVLTEDDVVSGRDFPDQIARGAWGIDVHNPDGIHTGIEKDILRSYGVPYRCITPRGMDNLYVAGRPISSTHRANSSSRINGTCIALGEAIGLAAEDAVTRSTRDVDVARLQERLIRQGAVVNRTFK